jgi:predicted ArsR family transcriptional regulator
MTNEDGPAQGSPAGRDDLERQIEGVSALRDPVRRRLYEYVGRAGEVSRNQAADALGIQRPLAAFHLDRLVEEGLLDIAFRRLSGRTGPGAGRPAKLYRRSERQLQVTMPVRQYELAARLFADALEGESDDPRGRLSDAARDLGYSIGAQARAESPGDETAVPGLTGVLSEYGFEPYTSDDGTVYLRNCPFHALAQQHRDLVCGMNLELMAGLVSGLDSPDVEARLEPAPGRCCVALHSRAKQ